MYSAPVPNLNLAAPYMPIPVQEAREPLLYRQQVCEVVTKIRSKIKPQNCNSVYYSDLPIACRRPRNSIKGAR